MAKFALRYALAFIVLLPAQGVVFNHMTLFSVAVPLVFLWLLVSVPVTVGTNLTMLLGFLTGLGVDIFCDTPVVNALSCTVVSFAHKPLFHLYSSFDDDLGGRSPSSASMGAPAFVKFLLTTVVLYCVLMFTIEAFQMFNFRMWILRVTSSTIYTFIMLYAADCLRPRRE